MTNLSSLPKVTLGFISYNRLYYLRATLESAKQCIHYPNLEWIVVDGCSVESGLQDYLRSCNWLDKLIVKPTKFVDCLNILVQESTGEYILLWPDDMQFIVEGGWLVDLVEILANNAWIGAIGLNPLRQVTIQRFFTMSRWLELRAVWREIRLNGFQFRFQSIQRGSHGISVRTYGRVRPGFVLDGIPTLTRTAMWRQLGPWRARGDRLGDLIDAGEGAADDMNRRAKRLADQMQRATMILSVAADIVTDPTGTKAKVRDNKRYGVYMAPPEGTFYYKIYAQKEVQHLASRRMPVPFEEFVKPLGYTLPFDDGGNLLKSSINTTVVSPLE